MKVSLRWAIGNTINVIIVENDVEMIIPIVKDKAYGQLVLLDFAITSFTSIAYQRHSL